MAKCAICNKKIGLFGKSVKLYDEVVCQDCWDRLGFNEEDKEKYKYKAAAFLARGKAECEAVIAEGERKANAYREYNYAVVGAAYDNDDGTSRQKLLKSFLQEECDEKYDGMTNKDIKEECDFDEKYWEYPETDTDGYLVITEFEGEPAIKVFADLEEKSQIGWIPKESVSDIIDMVKKHPCEVNITIYGGKYKMLDLDGDKEIIITEQKDYGARVIISYDADAPAPSEVSSHITFE